LQFTNNCVNLQQNLKTMSMKKSIVLCLAVFAVLTVGCKQKELGENEQALEALNESYKTFTETNGDEDTALTIANQYTDLSSRFEEEGNLEKSIECDKTILEIYSKIWDKPVEKVAFMQWSIGYKYRKLNELDSADAYLNKAIETAESVEKDDISTDSIHQRFLSGCYQELALLYSDKGDHQKAIESIESVFKYQPLQLDRDKEVHAAYSDLLATIYNAEGDFKASADYYEKALTLYKEVCPDSITLIDNIRESLLEVIYQAAINDGGSSDILSNSTFSVICDEGDTPAKQQGMTGEYVLLEYADWNMNSKVSLYDIFDQTKEAPIDIVIMRDDIVEKHHFEKNIGIRLHLKEVGKTERDRINKVYTQWKTKN